MKIVMTGGGTSGHITPNIALFDILKKKGFDISYIGTAEGIENTLISKTDVPFYTIKAGKLRRYIDFQNIKDIGRIVKGYFGAERILRKIKPDVVFSKGGFVSCPVVWAAKRMGIPVVLHESDITPGLANKLCLPFADKVCYAFKKTGEHLPQDKSVYTGLPVREELLNGNRENGLKFLGFSGDKPVLTLMGGSLGSEYLNGLLRTNLSKLTEIFDICHLCGKGNIDESLINVSGYAQYEYVNKELSDVMAATDFFVSRAGATAIFEFLALNKPMLLIPLSKRASRGDQIDNSKAFKEQGYAEYVEEESLTPQNFYEIILNTYKDRDKYKISQSGFSSSESAEKIADIILSVIK